MKLMLDPIGHKREENIASYVLSMWHIEDLMRANDFDIEAIEDQRHGHPGADLSV